MFTPVQGDALNQFDPETIELYRRRDSNPTVVAELMQMPRRARHHLPIFLDKEKNPEIAKMESEHNSFIWKLALGGLYFSKWLYCHINLR